jgi:hypothetical protein
MPTGSNNARSRSETATLRIADESLAAWPGRFGAAPGQMQPRRRPNGRRCRSPIPSRHSNSIVGPLATPTPCPPIRAPRRLNQVVKGSRCLARRPNRVICTEQPLQQAVSLLVIYPILMGFTSLLLRPGQCSIFPPPAVASTSAKWSSSPLSTAKSSKRGNSGTNSACASSSASFPSRASTALHESASDRRAPAGSDVKGASR